MIFDSLSVVVPEVAVSGCLPHAHPNIALLANAAVPAVYPLLRQRIS